VAVVVSKDGCGRRNACFAGLGDCQEGEALWASKQHVSTAFERPCSYKK
jgi:hypothetical protein